MEGLNINLSRTKQDRDIMDDIFNQVRIERRDMILLTFDIQCTQVRQKYPVMEHFEDEWVTATMITLALKKLKEGRQRDWKKGKATQVGDAEATNDEQESSDKELESEEDDG